jgi:hypothetical protein
MNEKYRRFKLGKNLMFKKNVVFIIVQCRQLLKSQGGQLGEINFFIYKNLANKLDI